MAFPALIVPLPPRRFDEPEDHPGKFIALMASIIVNNAQKKAYERKKVHHLPAHQYREAK